MKKLLWIASLMALSLIITGCEKTLETPKEPVVDASLPRVESIRTLPGSTEVGFEWTPIYSAQIEGYYLYRQSGNSMKKIATIKDRYISHYVDTELKPNTSYAYQMSTYSPDKHESGLSMVANVTTLAPVAKSATLGSVEPVSFITAISELPARIKIIWRPHAMANVEYYIIERNEYKSTSWDEVGKVKGRLNAEYIDQDIKDNYVYRYRVKVKTNDGVLSKPSDTVEAHSKALPRAITGVKASSNLPKKIVLTWSPSTTSDFAYYKVYRSPTSSLFYSFYGKTVNTEFEDLINENGKTYYYRVVAVDVDGLESKQEGTVTGMTLSALNSPVVRSVKHDGGSIYITWGGDDNAIKYTITKEFELSGKTQKQSFTGIFESNFIDQDTLPGVEYKYKIIAIDKYGIASNPSDSVVIKIPKE
ncbi:MULTISPECIES: hypothetical protein [unclassified Sulfurospirillum]|uniref:fibronectin type III domain-containing protein n=1 Tax=unclassified Sulfurospirillum TaxID=2618290 RepID=UPI0025E5A424|nr:MULTISPECIES: hypothetical protein [unclassified Sulfurospirillum]